MIHSTRISACVLFLSLAVQACTHKAAPGTTTTTPAHPVEANSPVVAKPIIGIDSTGDEEPMINYTMMDEVDIRPENETLSDTLAPYNASHTFEHDLIHTKIEISFDWDKKRAKGVATLSLRPWFYSTDKLVLDAKNFDIASVVLEDKNLPLQYQYDTAQLKIQLDRTYTRNETFKVKIRYTAKPDERSSYGGSSAITSDKGLYFINTDGSDPEKPRQIWTQGETESNSFWFPTIDKPNERCTQEMLITVDKKYKTLSNGTLVSSTDGPNNTRTDYWRMDKPHAPYLFMMAIGEFAVVKDKWRNLELSYYVEPKYEAYAKDIFPYTPEMLEFFSKKLNYDYPWSKFAQVVVRDYVSGAMENTTAVIFGEYMQKTKRELLDDHLTNEKVVAHEMFHHWFGDLVTTENWANLTLNEGFANYSEYLWMEYKYGRDAADHHLMTEQQGYIFSATDGGHPLIHYGYENREDMFDAHSYNKGGAVLHMLRQYVGDDAFFAAFNRYLMRNEYTEVEVDELRMAFEDVTGQDLHWFFNQWFIGSGHPSLMIDYAWDDSQQEMKVSIIQEQAAINGVAHVFDLPINIDLYDANGKVRREAVRLTKRSQTFSFKCAQKPALVNTDADKALLCVKTDKHTQDEWVFMYRHAPLFRDRYEALSNLEAGQAGTMACYEMALKDPSAVIRKTSLQSVDIESAAVQAVIAEMAAKDKDPEVRASAIALLGKTGDKQYIPILQQGLGADQAYSVVSAALNALQVLDPAAAIAASKPLENDDNDMIIGALAELYAGSPHAAQLSWFQKHAGKVDFMSAFTFFEYYQVYITGLNDAALLDAAVENWNANAMSPKTNSEWRRFASTKALADTRNFLKEKGNTDKANAIDALIAKIKEQETDETLKLYYGMF